MDDLQTALDSRLEEALQSSNYRQTLTNQLALSKLQLHKDLTLAINGGTFKVTPTLISFVNTLIGLNHKKVVLLDVNETPIMIEKLNDFLEMIVDTYYEAHNTYLAERDRLRKSRTSKAVVGEK